MKKFIFIFLLICTTNSFAFTGSLYRKLELKDKIEYSTFKNAIKGSKKISHEKNKDFRYLTIIDFTKPSTKPRFLLIDLKEEELLYYTYVTHGKNSGKIIPTNFSNNVNSFQSSLGFYIVDKKPYYGQFGYSIRLIGLEEGFNSNAYIRSIVIHGAQYASEDYIKSVGFLGRTLGCPAVPLEFSHDIIDTIQDNAIVFIIGNDDRYLSESEYIN